MSNIINFGGSGSAGGSSSGITAPLIGKDFTWTGGDGTYQVFQDVETNWRVKFLSSGTFTPLKDMVIDAFLVGGGGSGSTGGAGGGYTNTMKSIVLTANTPYIIEIGAGGAALESKNPLIAGNAGGNTSAFSVTANGGGGGGYSYAGGNGGSGGGSYNTDSKKGYDGGSDGSNGGGPNGGTGQGTTTREFGESIGDLYASGGSTVSGRAADGADNTGDGGGDGKAGGSGIVIIRNIRSIYTDVIEGILQVGQLITFDGMKWRVVHNDGNLWYLAFNTIEESIQFGDDNTYSGSNIANRCVTWMNAYISAKAKNFMQDVTVSNVTSKVFIPTYDQVNGGFSYYNSNSNRIATQSDGTATFWWTSTRSTTDSAYTVSSSGVLQRGTGINNHFGFRPHICIEYEA